MDDATAFERGAKLAALLLQGQALTARRIAEVFGVSPAQAKRDMMMLETTLCADVEFGDGNTKTIRFQPGRRA